MDGIGGRFLENEHGFIKASTLMILHLATYTLFSEPFKINMHTCRVESELSMEKQIFTQNGYPESQVDKNINSARDKPNYFISQVSQSLNVSPDDSLKESKRHI